VGEVASEGCSPSLWAGAESPVAGAVRLARSKLDNLRYLSGTESQRTFQIIYLESEEKPPACKAAIGAMVNVPSLT